jgi:uncharacterized membrane protein YbhN (UPF0104 family)
MIFSTSADFMRILSQSIPSGAKVHKNFLPLLRTILGLAAMVYLIQSIYQVYISDSHFWTGFWQFSPLSALLLFIVLLMMPLNWGIEMIKWRILTRKIEKLSTAKIAKSILIGISLGMITPRRTGEFAGRIMMLSPGNRLKGLLLNTAGSMSQLFITLLWGTAGLIAILKFLPEEKLLNSPGFMLNYDLILTLGIIFTLSIPILIGFLSNSGFRLRNNSRIASHLNNLFDTFSCLSVNDLLGLFMLSFVRYIVFVFQFWILMIVAGLHVPVIDFFALAAVIYLLMALIPLSAIWELGVRGSVALFVFGLYFPEGILFQPAVIAASTGLWIINLALPALAGSILTMGISFRNQIQDA